MRPSYAAAGSAAPDTANANMIFNYDGNQNFFSASASGSLGGGDITVRGSYTAPGDAPPNKLTINEFIYNGSGTAVITGMNTNGNVGSPSPAAGPATPLPVGVGPHFDAPINSPAATFHSWRTSFSCS